nr:low molecular weight phosphotyrosine protein phosphatase [Anaerolineae bacterium]
MTIIVTFVCLGNICRSPMAEAVFKRLIEEAGIADAFTVDSCGTSSWHAGEQPCLGTLDVLKKHGVNFTHRSRKIARKDLQTADFLVPMDRKNLDSIRRLGDTDAEVKLLLEYADDPVEKEVPDPYYEGGFDYVYSLVLAGCQGLLAHIRQQAGI